MGAELASLREIITAKVEKNRNMVGGGSFLSDQTVAK